MMLPRCNVDRMIYFTNIDNSFQHRLIVELYTVDFSVRAASRAARNEAVLI